MLFGDNSGYVGALRRSTKATQLGSEKKKKIIIIITMEQNFVDKIKKEKKKKRVYNERNVRRVPSYSHLSLSTFRYLTQ
jgi:hypothetical protein